MWYTRGLSLSAGILLALVLWNQIDDGHAAEAHACLLAILAGTNLVAAADDLVSLFLALELVSIPTYVILYLAAPRSAGPRGDRQVFSAQRVFVGARAVRHELAVRRRGHDEFRGDWRARLARTRRNAEIACCKSRSRCCWPACVSASRPCRFTSTPPTCFKARPPSNAALLSFVPKVVGFVALLRLLPLTGAGQSVRGTGCRTTPRKLLLAVLAVATMFVGNLMALRQNELVSADGLFQHRPRRLHARRPGRGRCASRSAARRRCCSTWRRTA